MSFLNMAMSPYFPKIKKEISEKKKKYSFIKMDYASWFRLGQLDDTQMLFNIHYTMDEKFLTDVKVI